MSAPLHPRDTRPRDSSPAPRVGRTAVRLKPWGTVVLVVVVAVIFGWPAWGFIALTGGLAADGYNHASPCPPDTAASATNCVHVTPYLLYGTKTVPTRKGGHDYYVELIAVDSAHHVEMRLNTRNGWVRATELRPVTEVKAELYRGALMGVRLPGGQLLASQDIPSARIDQGIAILTFPSVLAVAGIVITRVIHRQRRIRRPPPRPVVLVAVAAELLVVAALVTLGAAGQLSRWAYTSGIIALAGVLTAQTIAVFYHPAGTANPSGHPSPKGLPGRHYRGGRGRRAGLVRAQPGA